MYVKRENETVGKAVTFSEHDSDNVKGKMSKL